MRNCPSEPGKPNRDSPRHSFTEYQILRICQSRDAPSCPCVSAVLVAIATVWDLLPLFAATRTQTEVPDIAARGRLFPELGPGLRAIKRDSSGRYYVLAAPATTISVYGTDGKRVGQIPAANSQGAKIVFADDIDIDATGRLLVADRGANAVKIFKADGSLDTAIPVQRSHVGCSIAGR